MYTPHKTSNGTNKTLRFFCHSFEKRNPVVVVVALTFLVGAVFAPTYRANALTRAECFNSSEHEGDPECLAYLQQDNGGGQITSFGGLIQQLRNILDTIVPFLIALGVFVIIYEVFTYVRHAGDEEKRTEARLYIVYSVVGIFVMISIWGLINILVNSLHLSRGAPQVQSVFPSGP